MILEKNEHAVKEVIDFGKGNNFLYAFVCPKYLSVKVVQEIPQNFTNAGPGGEELL